MNISPPMHAHARDVAPRAAFQPGPYLWFEALLVFGVALLMRIADQAGLPPHPDDLLHLYAARSYLADGSFSIFGGSYLRSADFTRLVAGALAVFGDSLFAARMPAMLSGAALVAAVYAWLAGEAGRGPALIAAGMLALLAPELDISVLVRFYTLQSLLFWLGAWAIYAALVRPRSMAGVAVLLLLGAIALAEAARLQVASAIGIGGLLAWASLFLTWRLRNSVSWWLLALAWAGLLLAGAALLWVLVQSGIAGRFWDMYRNVALWALPERDNFKYYYYEMSREYGLLLDLLPLATVAALAWYPRQAIFCAVILVCGLVLQSFGGMKAPRYIAYLLPFFAGLWALGSWPLLLAIRDRLLALSGLRLRRAPGVLALSLSCFAAILVAKAVPVLETPYRSLLLPGFDRPRDLRDQGWLASSAVLRPLARQADVFVTGDDLLADFHVARADLVLNRSRLLENRPPQEYVTDFRSGTPTISTDESVFTVLACFNRGLIVTYEPFLRWLSPELRAFLDTHTRTLDLAPDMAGFAWEAAQGTPPVDCAPVRQLVAATAAERRGTP